MLTYEDYQLLKELKERDKDAYELINKISAFSQESASHACHDLRNYAGLIDNYCQLLAMTMPDIEQNTYFQKITSNLNTLMSLFNEISRFRYSFKQNEPTTINLVDCLNEAINDIKAESYPQMHEIVFHYETSANYPFQCKNSYLKDAFLAILRNALESCNSQPAKVNIELALCDSNYEIRITDNGNGFSTEMLSDGTTPFVSEKSRHFGLGLSTASIIILKNDGNIQIHNLDCGAAITITLPK